MLYWWMNLPFRQKVFILWIILSPLENSKGNISADNAVDFYFFRNKIWNIRVGSICLGWVFFYCRSFFEFRDFMKMTNVEKTYNCFHLRKNSVHNCLNACIYIHMQAVLCTLAFHTWLSCRLACSVGSRLRSLWFHTGRWALKVTDL